MISKKKLLVNITIIIILTLLLGLLIGFGMRNLTNQEKTSTATEQNNKKLLKPDTVTESNNNKAVNNNNNNPCQEIKLIAEKTVREHNYTENYKCINFSEELTKKLINENYEAYYCTGTALWCNISQAEDNSCEHAWVKVCFYIESTTGKLLSPDYYIKNYGLPDCKENS